MKTSVIEVHAMLSVLSVEEVEKRIGEVHGVESATVNFAARSATVRYDETRLDVGDIRSAVRQSGYESNAPAVAASDEHQAHSGLSATSTPLAAKTAAVAPDSAVTKSTGATESKSSAVPSVGAAAPVVVAGGIQQDPKASGKM